jgi:hypothetical protein
MFPSPRVHDSLSFLNRIAIAGATEYRYLIAKCPLRNIEALIEVIDNRDKFYKPLKAFQKKRVKLFGYFNKHRVLDEKEVRALLKLPCCINSLNNLIQPCLDHLNQEALLCAFDYASVTSDT